MRDCAQCGNPIDPLSNRRVVCSDRCAVDRHRDIARESSRRQAQRRAGQPKGDQVRVVFMLTTAERAALRQTARSSGTTVKALIRDALGPHLESARTAHAE